jgi:predicted AlkP superfamily pyrophosphatase or phosphodiesterase
MTRKLLVLDVATLHPDAVRAHMPYLSSLAQTGALRALEPSFPALSCSSHATMLTGVPPRVHGIVGNGWYERDYASVRMWQRSNHLVNAEPLWEAARSRQPGLRCANLFWRQCADSTCDTIVTERPAYWASGRKTFDFHATPAALHDELTTRIGRLPFPQFWGPLAGVESTRWILKAAQHVMQTQAPELLLVYAPYLDYDAERYGTETPEWTKAAALMDVEVRPLIDAAREEGRDVVVVSDYGWAAVDRPILINQALRRAGLLEVERLANGERLECGRSRAFAVVDSQMAHVYVADPQDLGPVRALIEGLDGVAEVLDHEAQTTLGIDHPRSGDLIAIAGPTSWFAYPYWLADADAPDFRHCIAIFDKIGWDPTEILFRAGAFGGRLRLGVRALQKALRLAVPFDVIGGDPTKVRAARRTAGGAGNQGPVLITSWPLEQDAAVPMTALKNLLLDRICAST